MYSSLVILQIISPAESLSADIAAQGGVMRVFVSCTILLRSVSRRRTVDTAVRRLSRHMTPFNAVEVFSKC